MGVHARAFYRCCMVGIISAGRAQVSWQSVCQDGGPRLNGTQEKGSQGFALRVRNDLQPATAKALVGLLYGHPDENFAGGASPALTWMNAADHCLVHFNNARKSRMTVVPNGAAQTMKHCPSGLVGTKSKKSVKRFGRYAIFWGGHMPSGSEPYREGRLRMMEDRSGRSGHPAAASAAPPTTIVHAPPFATRALRTQKARRPAQPVQIVEAGCVIRKPAKKIGVVPGVVLPGPRLPCLRDICHPAMLPLPHLYGYPTRSMTYAVWCRTRVI